MKKRLLIISTHPIQYHAPLFNYLSRNGNIDLKVFYTNGQSADTIFDKEFGKARSWKIDLLEGYDYEFIENKGYSSFLPSFFSIVNPKITQRIDAFKPSIIIIYGWNYFSHLQIMLKYKGKVPIVFRGDSTSIDDDGKNVFYLYCRYKFLKWVYRHIDYVFSPGSASDIYFFKCGIANEKIIRVEHAVDNNWFSAFSNLEHDGLVHLKSSIGLKGCEIVFLFAGKFIEKKNPLLMINAFTAVAAKNKNVKLILVGDGKLASEIYSAIELMPLSIANRVIVLPFQNQPQMKKIYRLASFFVLPSKGPGETWGLSVNESLACGTPVIVSSKCGCAAEIVKEGVNGFTFYSDNLEDLIRVMNLCCTIENRSDYFKLLKTTLYPFSFESFKLALDNLFDVLEN